MSSETLGERITNMGHGDFDGKLFYELKELERAAYEKLSDAQDEVNEVYRLQQLLKGKKAKYVAEGLRHSDVVSER